MSSTDRREHLRHLLRAHAPSDNREATFLIRMLELCDVPGDPFSRAHVLPGHFTASAFVLSPDHNQLLMILHSKLHRWLQPGGHIDPDDVDVLAAAQREVAEEVGLSRVELFPDAGLLDIDIHDIPGLKSEPPHQHFDLRFLFVAPSLTVAAGSDAEDARWVPLQEVPQTETDDSVLRAWAKLSGR